MGSGGLRSFAMSRDYRHQSKPELWKELFEHTIDVLTDAGLSEKRLTKFALWTTLTLLKSFGWTYSFCPQSSLQCTKIHDKWLFALIPSELFLDFLQLN